MSVILERNGPLSEIILNRVDKHNAFNDEIILSLLEHLNALQNCDKTRVILIRANGKHFSAGADLNWMKERKNDSEEENIADAKKLAELLSVLHHHPKPTIAVVQGGAFGGGAGLVCACDIAFGSNKASFCFSETKLGLIPSAISPYVIKCIGPRIAKKLFLTAELIKANEALNYQILHALFDEEALIDKSREVALQIATNGPNALYAAKALIDDFAFNAIDETIILESAKRIAKIRVSPEGQEGLNAFLEKRKPNWSA